MVWLAASGGKRAKKHAVVAWLAVLLHLSLANR